MHDIIILISCSLYLDCLIIKYSFFKTNFLQVLNFWWFILYFLIWEIKTKKCLDLHSHWVDLLGLYIFLVSKSIGSPDMANYNFDFCRSLQISWNISFRISAYTFNSHLYFWNYICCFRSVELYISWTDHLVFVHLA